MSVVRLDDFRKSRQPSQPARKATDAEHYYCLRCDTDKFRLYANGDIHCARCESLMANIHVGEKK